MTDLIYDFADDQNNPALQPPAPIRLFQGGLASSPSVLAPALGAFDPGQATDFGLLSPPPAIGGVLGSGMDDTPPPIGGVLGGEGMAQPSGLPGTSLSTWPPQPGSMAPSSGYAPTPASTTGAGMAAPAWWGAQAPPMPTTPPQPSPLGGTDNKAAAPAGNAGPDPSALAGPAVDPAQPGGRQGGQLAQLSPDQINRLLHNGGVMMDVPSQTPARPPSTPPGPGGMDYAPGHEPSSWANPNMRDPANLPESFPDPFSRQPSAPSPISATASGTTVTFTNPDGTTYVQTAKHPVRDNNPLDMQWGPTARANGAIGKDGKTAVFPNADQGYAAAARRMDTIASTYSKVHNQPDGSLGMITYVWSPPSDLNDTEGMIKDISARTGLDRNTQWNSLSESQKISFAKAYAWREGYKGK